MTKLPEEIEATYLELAAVKERAKLKRNKVRSLELQITLEACSAKDEGGKPILKNEREREAAIATMLAESDEFKEMATGLSGDESDETHLMARLERLRMEFKVEMLEAEQRNHLAALKVADAIYNARHDATFPQEVELPFLIRPDSHLKKLICEATPEQSARAVVKAKDYYRMCLRLGVEPTEALRVLKEALQMEIEGVADVPDAGKTRDEYTKRSYTGNYREP